jgi:hypothetical protein
VNDSDGVLKRTAPVTAALPAPAGFPGGPDAIALPFPAGGNALRDPPPPHPANATNTTTQSRRRIEIPPLVR